MRIEQLKVQNLYNPLGIDTRYPVFSYTLTRDAGEGEQYQSAFRILAASSQELLNADSGDLWDSGICRQRETFGIVYKGKELNPREKAYWKVKVWDKDEHATEWSQTASWEMGLLRQEQWKGCWIGQGDEYRGSKSAAPMFVCDFQVKGKEDIAKARIYISGLGLFRASLNGRELADTFYDPGECDASKTVYYVTYDITERLQNGRNTLGVLLGNGQYTGFKENPVMALPDGSLQPEHRYQKNDGSFVKPGITGNKKLLAQVELTYQDGTLEIAAVSDMGWKWTESPILFQNWYGGEDYDGTCEQTGWNTPQGSRKGWKKVSIMKEPGGSMKAREFLPVQIMETFPPREVRKLPNGNWLVDMGRNGAGLARIILTDTTPEMRGDWIHMYPSELLKADGSGVDQASCTQSWCHHYHCSIRNSYRIKGTGQESWHPVFAYQGFQYVEVEGYGGNLTEKNFQYSILRTANEKNGSFDTSNELINSINAMVEHSMESNMFGAFTDCPQIEKLGWIETSHLMFRSLAGTYDINAWMRKIMHDIIDSQLDEEQALLEGNQGKGYIPAIVPEYQRIGGLCLDPNWSGACIFTPWEHYQYYGDAEILRESYETMVNYLEYLKDFAPKGVLDNYAQMGEWGEINEKTPTVLVATCAYYRMLCIVAQISGLLGSQSEMLSYQQRAEYTRAAFHKHPSCYQEASGIYGNDSQASYGCVIYSGIVPEEKRLEAVMRLVEAVKRRDYHLSSGEVGLKQVFIALAENGRSDVVYQMVMNETSPSYRYFAEAGLTTLPEYWNCEELWHGMVRSRNHAMMGHVKEWFTYYMLGIRPLEPGFRSVLIAPYIPEGITYIKGELTCPFGVIRVECIVEKDDVKVNTDTPPGVRVILRKP